MRLAVVLAAVISLVLIPRYVLADPPKPAVHPNIIYILCDDLGYGDVHSLNPTRGKIATPNIDRLASQGLTFTDAHAVSSVCTPSRYGILTGRYSWRSRLQSDVLSGYDPPLIPPSRMTVPALLKQNGYATACIGKWHLGLKWAATTSDGEVGVTTAYPPIGTRMDRAAQQRLDHVDYLRPIQGGPTALGFDTFFGIPASLDMPPFVWIENDHATREPGIIKALNRTGLADESLAAVDVIPTLVHKSTELIEHHLESHRDQPLFLFLCLTSPHTPLAPTPEWVGKSGLGPYGDFVMETDWAVGEVLNCLDRSGIADNTLVMFASDNGCAPYIGVERLEALGHFPSAQFRGYKADIWDGGHRIPYIVRWPGRTKAGSRSDQLVGLCDLLATCGELLGTPLAPDAGEDSVSLLPALLGTDTHPLRTALVHHSFNGNFAIRQGEWKLDLCPGSGGWSKPLDIDARANGLPPVQLYRMSGDEGEEINLEDEQPKIVKQMTALLEKYVADGRSTPGPVQKNDVHVDIMKMPVPPKGIGD